MLRVRVSKGSDTNVLNLLLKRKMFVYTEPPQAVKNLLLKHIDLSSILSNHVKCQVIPASYNPNVLETKTGRSLGLAGLPAYLTNESKCVRYSVSTQK